MEKKFIELTEEAYNNFNGEYERKIENYNSVGKRLKNHQITLKTEYLNLTKEKHKLEEEILKIKNSIVVLEISLSNNSFELENIESDYKSLIESAESLSIKAKSSNMLKASMNMMTKEIQDGISKLKLIKSGLNSKRANMLSDKNNLQTKLVKLKDQLNGVLSQIHKNKKNQSIIEQNIRINDGNRKRVDQASIICKEAYYNSESEDQISAKFITPMEKPLKKIKRSKK